MKIHLYIFTDTFPYGTGEKPFVLPELDALLRIFRVTIISCADEETASDETNVSALPDGVELIHWRRSSKLKRAPLLPLLFFSCLGRRELKQIAKDGLSAPRIFDSAKELATAFSLLKHCEHARIFEDCDDSLYYSFWFGFQNLMLALAKQKHSTMKIASRLHGYELYDHRRATGRQPFQRIKRDSCDLMIFASVTAMSSFEKSFGPEKLKGQYVLNRLGVKHSGTSRQSTQGSDWHVVSCSNVIPLKRVTMIAEALGALARSGMSISWTHFGNGPQLDDVIRIANENKLSARFPGHVPNSTICQHYRTCCVDVFVHASETEGGCPVAIQEALAWGIPIVGVDSGGVSETIQGNGVLLPHDSDSDEMSKAIEEVLLSDAQAKAKMRARSLDLWSSRFNSDVNKEALLHLLAALCGETAKKDLR